MALVKNTKQKALVSRGAGMNRVKNVVHSVRFSLIGRVSGVHAVGVYYEQSLELKNQSIRKKTIPDCILADNTFDKADVSVF